MNYGMVQYSISKYILIDAPKWEVSNLFWCRKNPWVGPSPFWSREDEFHDITFVVLWEHFSRDIGIFELIDYFRAILYVCAQGCIKKYVCTLMYVQWMHMNSCYVMYESFMHKYMCIGCVLICDCKHVYDFLICSFV